MKNFLFPFKCETKYQFSRTHRTTFFTWLQTKGTFFWWWGKRG